MSAYMGRCAICETTVWRDASFGDGGTRDDDYRVVHVICLANQHNTAKGND